MKYLALLAGLLGSAPALATMITVDPDDYAEGTVLNNVSEYVTITAIDGVDEHGVIESDVFAASFTPYPGIDVPTGPLGDRVFSPCADRHCEWQNFRFFPDVDMSTLESARLSGSGTLLQLEFHQPIDYFSMLGMETYWDGFPSPDDPNWYYFYDAAGNLVHNQGYSEITEIPVDPEHAPPSQSYAPHAYNNIEYFGGPIKYVLATGDSEPVILDRLIFRHASVPEPSTLALFGLGLLALGYRRKTQSK